MPWTQSTDELYLPPKTLWDLLSCSHESILQNYSSTMPEIAHYKKKNSYRQFPPMEESDFLIGLQEKLG